MLIIQVTQLQLEIASKNNSSRLQPKHQAPHLSNCPITISVNSA